MTFLQSSSYSEHSSLEFCTKTNNEIINKFLKLTCVDVRYFLSNEPFLEFHFSHDIFDVFEMISVVLKYFLTILALVLFIETFRVKTQISHLKSFFSSWLIKSCEISARIHPSNFFYRYDI